MEVLGKLRKKKKPCVTDKIFYMCDQRRELKPIRYESEQNKAAYAKN